jgi:hypothetical protein
MLPKTSNPNIPHDFSKLRNRNINVAGVSANKDYINLRDHLKL